MSEDANLDADWTEPAMELHHAGPSLVKENLVYRQYRMDMKPRCRCNGSILAVHD